jgi:Sap, sulfolipid-1-addressing protein
MNEVAWRACLLWPSDLSFYVEQPKRLLLAYWLGAMATGLILGVAIVEWLNKSGVVSTSKHTVSPGVDLALGALALVVAVVPGTGEWAKRQAKRRATSLAPLFRACYARAAGDS